MAASRSENPAAIGLADHCLYLAREGKVRAHALTGEFFGRASSSPELKDGVVLALHEVATSKDVHYPTWEMHPLGDEVLVVLSGALSVEFRDGGGVSRLASRSAFIVPAGCWHRIVVHEPSLLMAITPRHGTVHAGA